jgi:hypothetical protein
MKTIYIFLTSLILISSTCCAEWRNANQETKGMNKEECKEFLHGANCEFLLSIKQPKSGIKIIAIDGLNHSDGSFEDLADKLISSTYLRVLNGKVDYRLIVYKYEWNGPGDIYLDLLDEDKFLIESKFISRVSNNFTGEMSGSFNMTPETFKGIKYYRLSSRG